MDLRKLSRAALLIFAGSGLTVLICLLTAYLVVSSTLPKVETLDDYRPPIITKVYGDDGTLIAEYFKERRIVVPVEQMPNQLIQAFVSAEDSNFFEHQGIDLISIMRAAIANLKAGGIRQGGSTITQQVAKSFFLSSERSFSRKFREAILAWRMERHLSKKDILYLYLNQIFLGHGAYGVQAAAENYFNKNVEELTLAEAAMVSGLPQAPSRYSPYRHYDRAKKRQKYVLGRMVAEGYITLQESEAAFAEVLDVQPRQRNYIDGAGYFTEQVRRYLEDTYGKERLYTQGLEVHTTMNALMQAAAQNAVRENLRSYDKRQGLQQPQRQLSEDEVPAFLEEQALHYIEQPLEPGETYQGLLSDQRYEKKNLILTVNLGEQQGEIVITPKHWAAPIRIVKPDAEFEPSEGRRAARLPLLSLLQVVVEEIPEEGPLKLRLEQEPLAQGALVAIAPHTGQVKSMVGGYDFLKSQFNRAIQARRLPGSAIKPLIYAAALDKGYTPASIILDTPLIYRERKEDGDQLEWKPKNYEKEWYGPTTFREGLAKSRNIITIKILEDIGVSYAANYCQKLGITSHIERDLTLALGSTAVTPLELATVYAVFANGGVRVTPTYITKIVDRDGRVLESLDPADFPEGPQEGQRLIRQTPERVISPETAYLVTNLMESVVRRGTGWRAKALRRPAAGKTGTTNDLKDAWFAGYVPQLVTISWVGYDIEKPLGEHETGSRAAAPAWVNFMLKALENVPVAHFPVPDTIEFRPIDPKTGLLVTEDTEGALIEVFAQGSAPTKFALDEERLEARDFFKLDF